MKKFLLPAIVLIAMQASAQTKPGYAINFKINGLKDSTAYLAYFYAESTYIKDTAKVNSKGEFTFSGKETMPQGMYFLVLNKTRIFDLVVGPNQHFTLETDTAELRKPNRNIIVKNDLDNKLFFDNIAHNAELSKRAEPFIAVLQDSTITDEAKKKAAREGYQKISDEANAYQQKISEQHPTLMSARLFKTSQPVHIPDPPTKADGTIDSTFQLRYYRQHFFDNFDLSDDALIRLTQPLYSKKVNEYLDKLYVPHPDSIMVGVDKMVSLAKKNPETYKFLIWTLTRKYENPEFMGMDEVLVQLYYKYYATGEMDYWANEKFRKNLKDLADRYCRSLIGKTAPNLMMQDVNLQPRSMYDIKTKYTIVYFYDPDCGSCKKETPVLVDFYTKNKARFNLEVFAVNSDTSMVKMRDYIKTMNMKWVTVNGPRTYLKVPYRDQYDAETTPTIYVLDEKKKIIAKKLPAARLEDFLTNYEKQQQKKAASGNKTPDRIPFDCSKPVVRTVPKS